MKLKKSDLSDKRFWLDFLMPNRCAFCNEIIKWNKTSCETCEENLPYIDKELCEKCGKPVCICERGITYDRCVSVCWYDELMRKAVVNFKINSPENFSIFFANKLCEILRGKNITEFDLVTCVQMTKESLRLRGYNQAEELGRRIAEKLNVGFDKNILVKRKTNSSQHALTSDKRIENARKAYDFNFKKSVKGKKILLCDDVITTGSTLNACSDILKKNGAEFVVCASACNTNYMKTV